MKIAITTFGADGGKSGISQYLINLIREFSGLRNGHSFDLLLYKSERDIFMPSGNSMEPLYVDERLRSPVVNIAWHQTALPRWCKKRNSDVLFLPAGNRRVPISAPCPMVGTVHDFSSIHVQGKYDPARMFYIKKLLPLFVRRLSKVITVSENSKKDIVEYAGVPESRVRVIYNGINRRVYFPRDKEAAGLQMSAKYHFRLPYLVYVSRLEHPGKNHVRLIRAFAQLKEKEKISHQLVLAGSDWNGSEEIRRAAAGSSASADIVFTGFMPSADLPDLYCGADFFMFPSLYEGFGIPIIEAMACKVPVACSNVSSMPEVAAQAALLFDPYNEESMEDAMRKFVTDEKMRESYGQKGLERSKAFDWAISAAETLEVMREVA